jgi:hypothetical protein
VVEQITQKADNLVHWWIRGVVPIYETPTPWYQCEGSGFVHVLDEASPVTCFWCMYYYEKNKDIKSLEWRSGRR